MAICGVHLQWGFDDNINEDGYLLHGAQWEKRMSPILNTSVTTYSLSISLLDTLPRFVVVMYMLLCSCCPYSIVHATRRRIILGFVQPLVSSLLFSVSS